MNVLYDYQAFNLQRFGGISNYFVQIIRNLPEDIQFDIAVKESDNVHLKGSELIEILPVTRILDRFISDKKFKGKSWLYEIVSRIFPYLTALGVNRNYSIDNIKKSKFDVFHSTFFSDYFLPYLNGKPFVLTIHDMIPELFFDQFGKRNIQLKNKKKLADYASHIVTVSQRTKDDVMDLLHVPESKISVIYHAAPSLDDWGDAKPIVDGKYILYVGNRDGYKNFMPMISELAPLLKKEKEIRVVCTGNPFSNQEKQEFKKINIQDQLIHVWSSDYDMMNLYAHAQCFIFPSLYEGFGIPILEAWQAGCPALLNRKSCFPEIAKDAAIFFNLDSNQSDLTEVMDVFLKMSEEEKNRLIDKQKERLAFFSWKKSAEQLAEIYRGVI